MTASPLARLLLRFSLFAVVVTFGTGAHALITGGHGNDPVPDHDWPDGTLAIANHKSRLGWWEGPPFGGGQFTFLYRGDAKAFSEALELLAKINWPAVELHVHAGPHEDFWLVERGEKKEGEKQRDPRIDWSFTVWTPRNFHNLYNNPASLFSSDRPEFRRELPPPKFDVYLGGGLIDWKDVKVPSNVRVVGSADEVLKDRPAQVRLHVYNMQTSKPIQGAQVRLFTHGKEGEKEAGQAKTDERGAAMFDKLEPGVYDVRVAAGGFAPRALGWQQYQNGIDKGIATELSPAAKVAGRVVNSKGEPIAKARVRTFVVLGLDGRGCTHPKRPETITDEQGRFELTLPSGFVQLSAQATGWYHSWTEVLPVGNRNLPSDSDEPVVIRMARTTTVTVNAADKAGKPAGGQSVFLRPVGNPVGKWSGSGVTDAQGTAVIQGVPPGEYRITDRTYPQQAGKEIRVEEGKAIEVEVSW